MPEIKYDQFQTYLSKTQPDACPPVFLIHGEESIYKSVLNDLLDRMLPGSSRNLSYDGLDGTTDNAVYEAIERLNTFSFLSEPKVIAILDSKLFYSKEDDSILLQKAKDAFDQSDMKKSAKFMINILNLMNLTLEDVKGSNRTQHLKPDPEMFGDDSWIDGIIEYCIENNLKVSSAKDQSGDLQRAIEKGFPKSNYLVITTDIIDRKRVLFKAIDKIGTVIDCSIPKGDRKADRVEQESIMSQQSKAILSKAKKKIAPNAYRALIDLTGFSLRTFCNNLEKLVSYIGDRDEITIDDVDAILQRTRQDPIYEMTNAISDKNLDNSLFFMDSLLGSGYFPLQILAAMTNQVRKLVLVKDFMLSPQGRIWHSGMIYDHFQAKVIPEIQKWDKNLIEQLEQWENMLSGRNAVESSPKGKKKKLPATDLLISKISGSPYPMYLLFKRAERFSIENLLQGMESLSYADVQLKSTVRNPKLILEEVIFKLCK